MLKQDPNNWRLRIESILFLVLYGLSLWNFFTNLSHGQKFDFTAFSATLIFIVAFLSLLYSTFVRRERYWRRLNRTRQDAADHKESYLAAKQPDHRATE